MASFGTDESEEEREQLQKLALAIIVSDNENGHSLQSLTASIDKEKLLKAAEPASKLTLVQVLVVCLSQANVLDCVNSAASLMPNFDD
jgi:hypothetical protein